MSILKDIKQDKKILIVPCIIAVIVLLVVGRVFWPSPKLSNGISINRTEVAEYKYVASVLREPFHDPNCKWAKKINPENLIGFKTRQDALDSGRRPCKVCKP